jgi:sugar lactone lactonase YvrE
MHRDKPTPHAIIPATNLLGEGILWDDIAAALCWTDIQSSELLFVSGALDGLSAQELAAQPHAGDVQVHQLSGVRGLPEPRFRGALRTAEGMPLG